MGVGDTSGDKLKVNGTKNVPEKLPRVPLTFQPLVWHKVFTHLVLLTLLESCGSGEFGVSLKLQLPDFCIVDQAFLALQNGPQKLHRYQLDRWQIFLTYIILFLSDMKRILLTIGGKEVVQVLF